MAELVPVQTVVEPAIEPPAETGSTVTVTLFEMDVVQTPLVTFAL